MTTVRISAHIIRQLFGTHTLEGVTQELQGGVLSYKIGLADTIQLMQLIQLRRIADALEKLSPHDWDLK